jgi:superfamily II RNA helicase
MAGRAGRRNIDTIGHVIMLTNLYPSLDTAQYYKLLNSPPKIIKSKFKINYSLILHYLNHYSIDQCIENIKTLNELNSAKASLNNVMKYIDSH